MSGKILFFVTEDWYFCSHRLPIARAAQAEGYKVVVVTKVYKHGNKIKEEGFNLIPLKLSRRSKNPIKEIAAVLEIIKIYQREKPDLVHHIALKPVIYGSIAAKVTKVPTIINALAGLGYVFSSKQIQARIIKSFVVPFFRGFLNSRNARVILQNPNDQNILIESKTVSPTKTILIRGSGVDTYHFSPCPEPESKEITIALVARMLRDKGVTEFVEAIRFLKNRGSSIKAFLVGTPDPENPTSIKEEQLKGWQKEGVVEWLGHVENVADIWAKSHIAVLPSYYGEGVPKSLIEAAACGRPIVTTDMPGCREIVRDQENGLLIPIRDYRALANALNQLIENPELRIEMGKRGRLIAEREFAEDIVVRDTMDIYKELLQN